MGAPAADPHGRGSLEINEFPRDLLPPSERDRLVAAMASCCAERGYASTSVEEVIARAGVPPRSFEENFADKSACGIAATSRILAEITAVASAAYSSRSSEWEILLRGVRTSLELLAARPTFARLACIEARQAMPPEAYALYTSAIRLLLAMLERIRAYADSETPRPPSATRAALGGSEALIRRELLAGRAERLPELLPDIIYGLLVPFLDQKEALRYAEMARELLKNGR
jgi:AcrR family transcriptional regulator